MYHISQVFVIYVAVMLLFLLQMFMYYCLYYPEKGLIVLSRKRSICFALNKNVKSKKVAAYCFDKSKNIFFHIRMPLVLVHAGLVARHNAHCLVLTADPSKIRPFKSMYNLNYYIHATSNNHCRLVGGVFCLILYDMKGQSFVIPFQVISGVKSLYKCALNSF